MVMTEVFERLKELQGVLAEKYMLEEKIEEAPKQLTSQDELLARLKKEYIEKNTKYDEVRASVEHLKAQLAEAEASRESGEKGMDSITTHREYEALDKQITEAKEREDAIRRDLTREEKTLAELNEILRTDEAMITAQEADLNSGKTSLAAEIDGYKQALGDLDKKEAGITPGIDQEIVYKFQRIIRRNSEGIVAVKNGVCTGCHMILPAQFANEVRDGEKILFCPYCSRILYHQDVAEDEEETYFPMDETGSLADFDDDFGDEEDLLEEGEARDDSDGEKPLGFEE
ncbi:MAG: nucleic acid-binding protein [Treponemataceae bacterium]|nr:nucleic acid-binding protein [Treponemataceae bacterium]